MKFFQSITNLFNGSTTMSKKHADQAVKAEKREIVLTPCGEASTHVYAFGHDKQTNTLAVQFKRNGSVYHYSNFTDADLAALHEANKPGELGAFISSIVKNPKRWPFEKQDAK